MAEANPAFLFEHRGHGIDLEPTLEQLRGHLAQLGVKPGMTVATTGGDRLLDLLLLFLLPRLECRFLPLDPALPPGLRQQLLRLADADRVIDDSFQPVYCAGGGSSPSPAWLEPVKSLWLLVATSGTTGDPALIELTGGNLLASARAANELLDLAPGDCWLGCLPTHHVAGLAIALRCLLAGARLSLLDRFEATEVLEQLATGRVTHLSLVPTMLHRLLEADPSYRPPRSLRVVLLGGAPASPALVQEALDRGWPVCPSYGLTEAASQVATLYPPPVRWQEGLVGEPLPHVEVEIGEEGRIRLRGDSLARHRIGSRGRHPLLDEEGWLATRDLGYLDGQGRLTVLGREDDLVISGGEKVRPALVESLLLAHPGLKEVAVVGVEDPRWGARVVACYCGEPAEGELEIWAREHLSGAHRPRQFVRLGKLPRNPMGKLLRGELRNLAALRAQEDDTW